jgi:hypothetical protein
MTPEGEVKDEIIKGLEALGCYRYGSKVYQDTLCTGGFFMPVQTGFGGRAVDFLVNYKGRFIAIEAKRAEGGKTTSLQSKFIERTNKTGGIGIVARCWEDVRERLP